jgi:hypothetical protein
MEGFVMPHFPKPCFRKKRLTWMVQINGRQHNLGRDRDAAFMQYHELMTVPIPHRHLRVVPLAPAAFCRHPRSELDRDPTAAISHRRGHEKRLVGEHEAWRRRSRSTRLTLTTPRPHRTCCRAIISG